MSVQPEIKRADMPNVNITFNHANPVIVGFQIETAEEQLMATLVQR